MISYFTSSSFLIFLSWSVIIAGIIQVALLFFSLKILNLHIIYTLKIFASGVGRFFRLFSVSFFSSGLLQINILIGTIIASYESGAISYLYYADRVYQLPLALIGIATIFISHVFINTAMTVGLIPVKGLPFPFISAGGSFLITSFLMTGIVLKLSVNYSE